MMSDRKEWRVDEKHRRIRDDDGIIVKGALSDTSIYVLKKIVREHNSHDALVKACQGAVDTLAGGDALADFARTLAALHAAIALATNIEE